MAWCHQATSHYLSQCWPRPMVSLGHNELTHWVWEIEWLPWFCRWNFETNFLVWKLLYFDSNLTVPLAVITTSGNGLVPIRQQTIIWTNDGGWVGLWGFLWWAPSAKGKDHHGVSSGWSSVWHRSNTGLSSTQYEQILIILGFWPFWLTPFFFRSITFWRAYG